MNQENGPQTAQPLPEARASGIPSPSLPSAAMGEKESRSQAPHISRLPRPKKVGGGRTAAVLACLALSLGGIALVLWWSGVLFAKAPFNGPTWTVRKEKLKLTIVARGTLESARNKDIYCTVRSGTKGSTSSTIIKWIIDEGSEVKKGDKLMELDSSGFQDQLKDKSKDVDNAYALKVAADENVRIQIIANESAIEAAKNARDLARIELEKYEMGDYIAALKDIEGKIETTRSDLADWMDRAAWSSRMVKKGLLSKVQADADQSRADASKITLENYNVQKTVLEKYTRRREIQDRKAKLEEAERAMRKAAIEARSNLALKEADKKSKESIYQQELAKKLEIEGEIAKCLVTSPQDGLVVYFVPEQVRGGGGSQQSVVAQGEPVREGQKMIQIPDLSEMLVTVRVPEAFVSHLHNPSRKENRAPGLLAGFVIGNGSDNPLTSLAAAGYSMTTRSAHKKSGEAKKQFPRQYAQIKVDSYSKESLRGHVEMVDTVASQMDWFASDVKVYKTKVTIEDSLAGLKPGMSAEVTIYADESPELVMVVPVQAVLGTISSGAERECFVLGPDGRPEKEPRKIIVGMSNERIVEIKSGLKEGDQVVLNPKPLLPEKDERKPGTARSKDDGEGKFGGPKGKGEKGKGLKSPAVGGKQSGGSGAP